MSDDFSFEDQGAAIAAPDSLARLNEKLTEAVALKELLDQLEADAAATKQNLTFMTTSVIPDMMAEIGMDECVQNGWKIKLSEFVSGFLPKEPEARARAIKWLNEHEGGDIIKSTMTVVFPKSQHNMALDLAARVEAEGFAPSLASDVHPQTLCAFARERLKEGGDIDTDVLGLYTGTVAKFSIVKEPKPKAPKKQKD